MDRSQVEAIVRSVVRQTLESTTAPPLNLAIPVEISARHVHLSAEHARTLFGVDQVASKQALSQPGQFLSDKRVRLIGPKSCIEYVAVLGPVRGSTQVEISATDARTLGIDAPLRLSGDLLDAAVIHLQAGSAIVSAPAAIIAQRHLHATPQDAKTLNLRDGQETCARVEGKRPIVLEAIKVRVSGDSTTMLHIDTDEANAAGVFSGCACRLISCGGAESRPPSAPVQSQLRGFDGKLLTEALARELAAQGISELDIKRGQVITPSALDVLRSHNVALRREGSV